GRGTQALSRGLQHASGFAPDTAVARAMSRFDDLAIGSQWESSRRTISAEDVAAFASLSGDDSPLHLDDEAAAAGPYGRRIAHGLLVLSCSVGLAVDAGVLGSDLLAFAGLDRLRFVAPVFIGDTIAV